LVRAAGAARLVRAGDADHGGRRRLVGAYRRLPVRRAVRRLCASVRRRAAHRDDTLDADARTARARHPPVGLALTRHAKKYDRAKPGHTTEQVAEPP